MKKKYQENKPARMLRNKSLVSSLTGSIKQVVKYIKSSCFIVFFFVAQNCTFQTDFQFFFKTVFLKEFTKLNFTLNSMMKNSKPFLLNFRNKKTNNI